MWPIPSLKMELGLSKCLVTSETGTEISTSLN